MEKVPLTDEAINLKPFPFVDRLRMKTNETILLLIPS